VARDMPATVAYAVKRHRPGRAAKGGDVRRRPVERAIFVDNDPHQIKSVGGACGGIHAYKVAETDPGELDGDETMDAYRETLRGGARSYVDNILPQNDLPVYDPVSGINERDSDYIVKWAARAPTRHTAVIFDWDQTITKFNGVFPHTAAEERVMRNRYGITERDRTSFYVGGDERRRMLRDLAHRLRKMPHVSLYVLTNNPIPAKVDEIAAFEIILSRLGFGDRLPRAHILSAYGTFERTPDGAVVPVELPARVSKVERLRMEPQLRDLC
jgi:hypothetical protein